jgi:PhnB protein
MGRNSSMEVVDGRESAFRVRGYRTAGRASVLIVSNADDAIDFYRRVFGASELERHTAPTGGVAHAKLQIGEHPDASSRDVERLPRVGLRLYVTDVDDTYARALAAGATGDAPSDRPRGSRAASVYDPFGLTWWLVATIS